VLRVSKQSQESGSWVSATLGRRRKVGTSTKPSKLKKIDGLESVVRQNDELESGLG
jgi:hypothetical protein